MFNKGDLKMARKKVEDTLRPQVKTFADKMENRLKEKDGLHPDGWSGDTEMELHTKLDVKRYQLFKELQKGDQADKEVIVSLATDVANFAMMIADKQGE
jgi:hypothetical protein